tara:strand:+ start:3881 stop:4147 length:267 start_codon:yes stop_codon:yes gene_type:complete
MPKLKLERFRKLYKSLKTPWKPLNWLILGYLIGIENRYIEIKSAHAVDVAVRKFKAEYEHATTPPEIKMKKTEDGWEMSIGEVDEDIS